jgi:hypothetical protein
VIDTLYEDGTMSELSLRYMGEEQLEPTPTPAPTTAPQPTSTPEPGQCTNRIELGKDPAVGDVKPGTAFTKLAGQNSGTCTWGKGYQLVMSAGKTNGARGERRGQPTLTTSSSSTWWPRWTGVHQGLWQMVTRRAFSLAKTTSHCQCRPGRPPPPTDPDDLWKFWADDYHIRPTNP